MSPPTPVRVQPNAAAIEARKARGWSQRRLAYEIVTAAGEGGPTTAAALQQVERVERGETRVPGLFYQRLFCAVLGRSPAELFGQFDGSRPTAAESSYDLTSHKFAPMYLGEEAARQLGAGAASTPWDYVAVPLDHPGASSAALHVFPFGVGVVHLVEDLMLPNIARLAVWRRDSYPDAMAWAGETLADLAPAATTTHPEYVLSAYWLHQPIWTGAELETAMRLLGAPSALVDRDPCPAQTAVAHAEVAERALLRDGFEHPDLVSFGLRGVSIGCASWSGVAYHPIAERRALLPGDIVAVELLVQALWCYCSRRIFEVENGLEPQASAEYGPRFLKASRSRLTVERPQEASQHRLMREAVVATSGLSKRFGVALDVLQGE